MKRSTSRPALNALAVLLLTGCASGPGATLSPVPASMPIETAVATPRNTVSQTPSPSLPTVEPTDFDPGSLSWVRLGTLTPPDPEKYFEFVSLVGFDDGYVAFGNSDAGAWLAFSSDGIEWRSRYIAGKPCGFSSSPRFGIAASNGREVLVVGRAGSTDPCEIEGLQFAAWRSSDGEHWAAAPAEGVAGITEFNPDALWWTPSGWHSDAGESPDGLTWEPIELPVEPVIANGPYGFAAADGTVLLRTFSDPVRLHIGGDGLPWREMPFPAGCEGTEIIAPPGAGGRDAWVFFNIDAATTCVSVDLERWSRGKLEALPGCGIRSWADTRFGIIATVDTVNLGNDCPMRRQYVSRDGLEWAPLAPDPESWSLIVDGPAGVISVGSFGSAWRLDD